MPSDPLQPDEKPTVNFWGVPLCMMNHFALAIFKIFCLFLSLCLFNMTFLGADHFAVILLGIHQVSQICSLRFFFRFWKFLFFISLNVFLFIDILCLMRSCHHVFLYFFKHGFLLFFEHIYDSCFESLFANPTSGSSQRQILLPAFFLCTGHTGLFLWGGLIFSLLLLWKAGHFR